MHRGIPFGIKLPTTKPIAVSGLTESELDAELEKGFVDLAKENIRPVTKADTDLS